jgi:hypothetical protein
LRAIVQADKSGACALARLADGEPAPAPGDAGTPLPVRAGLNLGEFLSEGFEVRTAPHDLRRLRGAILRNRGLGPGHPQDEGLVVLATLRNQIAEAGVSSDLGVAGVRGGEERTDGAFVHENQGLTEIGSQAYNIRTRFVFSQTLGGT